MKFHLSNLDEILQKVRNAHSKNYLNEAIVSYRAGAYRAALITTWIAVCVDIIEKIRELAVAGDPAAESINGRLRKINPNEPSTMLAFEKDLLKIACDDLELISVIEKMHLERLKEDRNICAHPTFSDDGSQFTPNAELALSYIVQASNYLLLQVPVKGKVVIQKIYELINEDSFPEDDDKAYTVLSSNHNLGRVRVSSVRNLTIILIKRLFKDPEGISLGLLARISASLGAISRIYPDIYNEVLSDKFSQMLSEAVDKQLKRIFPFIKQRNDSWVYVTDAERVRIESILDGMELDELIFYEVVEAAEKISKINEVLQKRVNSLKPTELSKLLSAVSSPIFKEQAIKLFTESVSFDSSEHRGKNIILPLSKYLSSADVDDILTGACSNKGAHGYNQILPAGSIDSFFAQFYDATKISDPKHSDTWIKFWSFAKDAGFSYSTLNAAMLKDGLITAKDLEDEIDEEVEENVDSIGDIPF